MLPVAAQRPPGKSKLRRLPVVAKRVLLIAVVAVVAAGLLLVSQRRSQPLKVSGLIEAEEIRLGSRVGGRVAKVYVDEGDVVQAGKVLVEFEPFDLLEREAEAQAKLAAQQAEYAKLVRGYRPEEIAQAEAHHEQLKAIYEKLIKGPRLQEKEAARAHLDVASAQLELAERSYQRAQKLYESHVLSREQMDETTQALKVARSTKIARQKELELLEEGTRPEDLQAAAAELKEAQMAWDLKQKGFRAEEIALGKASMEAADAALRAVQQQHKELKVVAPLEGVIESLDLQPGDLAAPGAPIMSMLDTSRLWARAYLPEKYPLQLGQKVLVSVDAFEGEFFDAEVTFISRQAEFTPSNVQTPEERSKQVFRIEATLREGLKRLRPGMSADVWLQSQGNRP
jgi:HlyD family secretion protein